MCSLDQWYSTGGTRTPGGTRRHLRGYVDYTICITFILYQQLLGYRVEEKLYLGVREQKSLNITALVGIERCGPPSWSNSYAVVFLPYFPRMEVGLSNHQYVCVCLCVLH
jgi:hypothetical protein